MRPRDFGPGEDLRGVNIIFFHLLRAFYGPSCMYLPHNYWCGDKRDDARASMWNTGYLGTQKEGLSAQAHSWSNTYNSWMWCALIELCYSGGGQGSRKLLRLTCPFHTHTHSESRGSLPPSTLLFPWMWYHLGDKWTGDRKLKGKEDQ